MEEEDSLEARLEAECLVTVEETLEVVTTKEAVEGTVVASSGVGTRGAAVVREEVEGGAASRRVRRVGTAAVGVSVRATAVGAVGERAVGGGWEERMAAASKVEGPWVEGTEGATTEGPRAASEEEPTAVERTAGATEVGAVVSEGGEVPAATVVSVA